MAFSPSGNSRTASSTYSGVTVRTASSTMSSWPSKGFLPMSASTRTHPTAKKSGALRMSLLVDEGSVDLAVEVLRIHASEVQDELVLRGERPGHLLQARQEPDAL